MSADYIDQVFGAGGLLAQRFPGYEPRPGQIELARHVDRVFADGGNLLGEAPTGVGKSLAYAVPATWHAARSGDRVVIATANIALQEQLVTKDLPLLRELLPWPVDFALAKGRSNYLCLDAFEDNRAALALDPLRDPEERAQWEQVQEWAESTTTGDLSELRLEPSAALRARFTTTAEDCLGKACQRYAECHAVAAKAAVDRAQVVVANYHLLFAHVSVARATGGEAGVLPEFRLLVCDEGHRLAEIARDFLGFRVTSGQVRWAAKLLAAGGQKSKRGPLEDIDVELKRRLETEADRFRRRLVAIRSSPDYQVRLRKPRPEEEWAPLCDLLRQAEDAYLRATSTQELTQARKVELVRAAVRCGVLRGQVHQGMVLADPENSVYFIEEEGEGRAVLVRKPVDVSYDLQASLFSPEVCGVQASATTSATLRSGDSFAYVEQELGLVGHCEELAVKSPFDLYEQALLVVPEGLPDPRGKEWVAAVAQACGDAVECAGGRTLCLFTSYRVLNAAYEHLEQRFGGRYEVLRQGQAPRTKLVRRFREDVTSVLLGTESFWEGVDVPGEALSCVVIDRLPFASPDDPLMDAHQTKDPKNWFKRHAVPRAVIAFRQGFGRLIRTVDDRGAVVVLDRRLVDKGYGKLFFRSLPEVRVSRHMGDVARFLGRAVPEGLGRYDGRPVRQTREMSRGEERAVDRGLADHLRRERRARA